MEDYFCLHTKKRKSAFDPLVNPLINPHLAKMMHPIVIYNHAKNEKNH